MSRSSVTASAVSSRIGKRGVVRYIINMLISLAFAPVVSFVVSCTVYGVTVVIGRVSDSLTSIVWDFFYAEVLFSIAITCLTIALGSERRVQARIKRYVGRASRFYPFLRKACTWVAIVLILLEVVYKVGVKHGYQIQDCWIFNVAVSVSLCVYIITQCVAHPEAYFGL